MPIVNIHEAKKHLSQLVEKASHGEPFIIAKAGKPLVRVVALNARDATQVRRLGFMSGNLQVPEDFDHMLNEQIDDLFNGES